MDKNFVEKIYKQTEADFYNWSKAEFFNAEKYQPKPYKLLESAYRLMYHVICGTDEAEHQRLFDIFALCAEINTYIKHHNGLFTV